MSGPPPGCDLGDGGRLTGIVCETVAEGTPLRWLTAYHDAPVVNWATMTRDWAQYAVISVAALDGCWLATRAREETAGRGAAYSGRALLAGTALWTLTALSGWLAVRVLRRRIHRDATGASRMAAGTRASS
jgi:hypothetical protein